MSFLAINQQGTKQLILLQHRNTQERAHPAKFNRANDFWITSFNVTGQRGCISAMNYLFGRRQTTKGWLGLGRSGERLRPSAKAGGVLCVATIRKTSLSQR